MRIKWKKVSFLLWLLERTNSNILWKLTTPVETFFRYMLLGKKWYPHFYENGAATIYCTSMDISSFKLYSCVPFTLWLVLNSRRNEILLCVGNSWVYGATWNFGTSLTTILAMETFQHVWYSGIQSPLVVPLRVATANVFGTATTPYCVLHSFR